MKEEWNLGQEPLDKPCHNPILAMGGSPHSQEKGFWRLFLCAAILHPPMNILGLFMQKWMIISRIECRVPNHYPTFDSRSVHEHAKWDATNHYQRLANPSSC
jgi:hypothetical protein